MQIAFWILKLEGLIIGIYSCYWLTLFSGHANNNPNAISLSSHFVGVPHCLHFLGFLNQLFLKKRGLDDHFICWPLPLPSPQQMTFKLFVPFRPNEREG